MRVYGVWARLGDWAYWDGDVGGDDLFLTQRRGGAETQRKTGERVIAA